jgi:uncharacterized protein
MITERFQPLSKEVQGYLGNESSGHDFYHAERVYNNALYIQQHEGGEMIVIGSAALVHDVCRPWEEKNGKSHFGVEALEKIRGILEVSGLQAEKIKAVIEVVRLHDIYDWTNKIQGKSLELKIVQDADNLDAIGAIGIARAFAFGGAKGLSIFNPGENLRFTEDYVDDPTHRTSTIAHFYEKLLKLKENMNTETGIKLAEGRHQIMENFLKQFFNEWEGKFTGDEKID